MQPLLYNEFQDGEGGIGSLKAQTFLQGAAILSLAALISKVLSALYRVPYQNITGNEGMYVYQQVYPLFSLFFILSTSGIPLAISSLVSERLANQDFREAHRIFRISVTTLSIIGILCFLALFFSAGQIAEWMGDRRRLTLPIQAVSFSLLIIPITASIRGYFQGYQNMTPTAYSQVLEQLIRVFVILGSAWFFISTGAGVVYAGGGAMLGNAIGGSCALLFLYIWGRKNRLFGTNHFQKDEREEKYEKKRKILQKLLIVSTPICLGSLIVPMYQLVDSFMIANLLEQGGSSHLLAIEEKGIFDRGQPLIQVSSFIATSIALSIVPAIVDALSQKKEEKAKRQSSLAMRWTILLGFPASVGLMVVAYPTNVMLFEDGDGSIALSILALTGIFSTLGSTSTGIMQGYGRLYLPIVFMLIGFCSKIIGNWLLVPVYGINGAAITNVMAYGIAAIGNLWVIKKEFGISIFSGKWKGLIASLAMMAFSAAIAVVTLLQLTGWLPERMAMSITAICSVLIGAFVYIWSSIRFGLVTISDLAAVPKLKRKWAPFIERWGLHR